MRGPQPPMWGEPGFSSFSPQLTCPLPGFPFTPTPTNRRQEGQVQRRGLALQPQRKRRWLRRRLRNRLQEDQRQAVICPGAPSLLPSLPVPADANNVGPAMGVTDPPKIEPNAPAANVGPPTDFAPASAIFGTLASLYLAKIEEEKGQLIYKLSCYPTGRRYVQAEDM